MEIKLLLQVNFIVMDVLLDLAHVRCISAQRLLQ